MLQSTFLDFARTHLPPPPARLLEVGCGQGELATALAVLGYDVLAIDPVAPEGERFRRVLLEDLDPEEGPFDAVLGSQSFHHMRDLDFSLDGVVALLRPAGLLVLDEHGWDLADDATLDWLHNQQRALAAAGHGEEPPASLEEMREEWEAGRLGVARFEELRSAIGARFDEQAFEWVPFLHRVLHGFASEVLEAALIEAQAIRALGFRYAGTARTGDATGTA